MLVSVLLTWLHCLMDEWELQLALDEVQGFGGIAFVVPVVGAVLPLVCAIVFVIWENFLLFTVFCGALIS